jgi:F5/8 type C domain-containing protein
MKKLALVGVIALAFSTTAMAADIAFYVGAPNVDGWYTVDEVTANVETIISMTGSLFADVQQFDDDQFDAFGAWVEENTDDGELDILWLNGCMPSVLYAIGNVDPDGSRIEEWLDGGNMVINVGDWFGYVSYEGGSRNTENGSAGAANILDLAAGIIVSADGTTLPVTAAGKQYLPSLNDPAPTSRPIGLSAVVAPWEVAAAFAQDAAGTQADPVVIHNTETGAYVAFVNQGGSGSWIDDRGITCSEFIANWVTAMVGLGNPSLALPLNPDDGVDDVSPDTVLEWASGRTAATHDVYFGTSFEDVNAATRANPLDVLVSESQSANTYDPDGLLEFGTVYYWRIDEVNSAPDFTIFKGATWSFTAEPLAYPIENIVATSNATSEANAGPENTINGSGLNELDQHSTVSGDMWLGTPGADPVYIQYDLGLVYKLHEMRVWNYNVQFELILGFGLKDVTIEYSTDGTEWIALGDMALAQATAKADYAANTTVDFAGVAARYVRITINSGYGAMGQYGLSEVRFLFIPASAREPQPADDAANVSVDTALAWRAGRDAVSHEVAIGTDPEALPAGDAVSANTYDPGALNLGTTYYWQVTAIQETESWASGLWSFGTQAYLVVDDFEAYDDDENRIYDTWIDGWINETGSTVGYGQEPFAEQTIVNSGSQSMPLSYDNAGVATAEAELELGQDWTTSGIQSLSLYFYGDATNSGGQLYVKIDGTKIAYEGLAANITDPTWHLWNIDLAASGASLSNVSSLTIGIEGSGAQGIVYIDDIRLYPEVLGYYKLPDVTAAGDTVVGVPNDGDWPDGETPDLAIDDDTATKFLHFKGATEPTGIQVTPLVGATVVTGLALTTANDAAERDPATFELYGSNAGIDGPYTLIASGDIVDFTGETAWPRFTKNGTVISFENTVAYAHYQVLFPTVRDPGSANSMQIAEVELIGETP